MEIKELRTTHAKTFDLGNGRRRIECSKTPKHFIKNGKMEDINTSIKNGKLREGYYHADLLNNSIGFKVNYDGSAGSVKVELLGYSYFEPVISGNSATWTNVSPGEDIRFVFWANKISIFRILRDASANKTVTWKISEKNKDERVNLIPRIFGVDYNNKPTKHSVAVSENKKGEYTIVDTFEGKVFTRRGKLRNREEIEPTYPVIIDPVVDITISTGSDDGNSTLIKPQFNPVTNTFFSTASSYLFLEDRTIIAGLGKTRAKTFTRFPGITIPMGATINSALLKLDLVNFANSPTITINAKDVNNPSAPTNFAGVDSPGTLASHNKVTNPVSTGVNSIDVSAIVQELVNSYDYSNESMLFFERQKAQGLITGGVRKYITMASSEGAGASPELVIDYSATSSSPIPRMSLLGVG